MNAFSSPRSVRRITESVRDFESRPLNRAPAPPPRRNRPAPVTAIVSPDEAAAEGAGEVAGQWFEYDRDTRTFAAGGECRVLAANGESLDPGTLYHGRAVGSRDSVLIYAVESAGENFVGGDESGDGSGTGRRVVTCVSPVFAQVEIGEGLALEWTGERYVLTTAAYAPESGELFGLDLLVGVNVETKAIDGAALSDAECVRNPECPCDDDDGSADPAQSGAGSGSGGGPGGTGPAVQCGQESIPYELCFRMGKYPDGEPSEGVWDGSDWNCTELWNRTFSATYDPALPGWAVNDSDGECFLSVTLKHTPEYLLRNKCVHLRGVLGVPGVTENINRGPVVELDADVISFNPFRAVFTTPNDSVSNLGYYEFFEGDCTPGGNELTVVILNPDGNEGAYEMCADGGAEDFLAVVSNATGAVSYDYGASPPGVVALQSQGPNFQLNPQSVGTATVEVEVIDQTGARATDTITINVVDCGSGSGGGSGSGDGSESGGVEPDPPPPPP